MDASAVALDRAVAAGAPLVVAVGGDGTIRQAAAALSGTTTPLAVVPGGTGNVLAGALRIGGIQPAIEAIRHGEPRTMDPRAGGLGHRHADAARPDARADEQRGPFLVACGMGLDARIMAAAEHEWKRRIRFGAYVGAAIRELTRLGTADFHIEADGDRIELRGYLVLVANAGELVPGRLGPRQPIDPDGWSPRPDRARRQRPVARHPRRRSTASPDRRPQRRRHPSARPPRQGHRRTRPAHRDRWRPSTARLARGPRGPGGAHRPRPGAPKHLSGRTIRRARRPPRCGCAVIARNRPPPRRPGDGAAPR